MLMSGNVSIRLSSDVFRMTGDTQANAVAIVQSRETGEVAITGLNGTTIDGKAVRTYPARANYFMRRDMAPTEMAETPGDALTELLRSYGFFRLPF